MPAVRTVQQQVERDPAVIRLQRRADHGRTVDTVARPDGAEEPAVRQRMSGDALTTRPSSRTSRTTGAWQAPASARRQRRLRRTGGRPRRSTRRASRPGCPRSGHRRPGSRSASAPGEADRADRLAGRGLLLDRRLRRGRRSCRSSGGPRWRQVAACSGSRSGRRRRRSAPGKIALSCFHER